MKLTKLDSRGIAHYVLSVLVVLAIAGIGTYLLMSTHAASYATGEVYGPTSGDKNYNPGHFTLANGPTKLTFQSDGNFVLYYGSKAKWSTGTEGKLKSGGHLDLSSSGNVIIWQYSGGKYRAIWQTGTAYGRTCRPSYINKVASYTIAITNTAAVYVQGNVTVRVSHAPVFWDAGNTSAVYSPITCNPSTLN